MNEEQGPPAPRPAGLTTEEKALALEVYQTNSAQSYYKGVPPGHELNLMRAYSEEIVNARWLPDNIRGDRASVFFLINLAQDLGLKWTQAVRGLFLTPAGKVGMEGNIMLALLLKHRFQVKLLRSDATVAEYWVKRPKHEGEDAFEWSCPITWEHAAAQGWPESSKGLKPPWKDRANMLRWRSLAFTARVVAADLLGGCYLPDELPEIDMGQDAAEPTTYRQAQEAQADAKAEADPKLAVIRKQKPPADPKTVDLKIEEGSGNVFADVGLSNPEEALAQADLRRESMRTQNASISTGLTENQAKSESADHPAEIPAPPPADAKEEIKDLFHQIQKTIGAEFSATKLLNLFYLGRFGHPDQRKKNVTPAQYIAAVSDVLHAITRSEDMRVAFTSDAEDFGKQLKWLSDYSAGKEPADPASPVEPAKKRDRPAKEKVETNGSGAAVEVDPLCAQYNWDQSTAAIARRAQKARSMPDAKFQGMLNQFKVGDMPEVDASSLLLFYGFTPDAALLKIKANQKGVPWREAVAAVNREFKGIVTADSNSADVVRAISNTMTEIISA